MAAGLPQGQDGAVVMLHDGGGDRSQTVAALGTLIEKLKERGYAFDTVTSAIDAPSPWHRATTSQRIQGQLVSGVVRGSDNIVGGLKVLAISAAGLAALRTLLLLTLARRRHARHPLGSQRPAAGVRRGARVQRGARRRVSGQVAGGERLSGPRDHRGRRRLHRQHGDRGRRARAAERDADPPGQRRQAGGPEHRHRGCTSRHPRARRRRHGLGATLDACAGGSVRRS